MAKLILSAVSFICAGIGIVNGVSSIESGYIVCGILLLGFGGVEVLAGIKCMQVSANNAN